MAEWSEASKTVSPSLLNLFLPQRRGVVSEKKSGDGWLVLPHFLLKHEE